ncbi:hypothetical protein, partial [Rhodopila globiformis]|uniref:hypothetical protein n=1 Tax=Rhodopila globiformis TaxID=1071 RepID=UPI0011B0BD87
MQAPREIHTLCGGKSRCQRDFASGSLATSLPAEFYPAQEVLAVYRLRWQIEIWPSWCVSRLTKGLRDSHAMPKLAQAAEFSFIDADQPQAVA